MTDEEFMAFLDAVALRDLQLGNISPNEYAFMRYRMNEIAKVARLAHAVADHPERTELYEPLAEALTEDDTAPNPVAMLQSMFDRTGVSGALDAHYDIIRAHLRRRHIPDEDRDLLGSAGMLHPEAEITIALEHMRAPDSRMRGIDAKRQNMGLGMSTNAVLEHAGYELARVANELRAVAEQIKAQPVGAAANVPRKRRKVFTGLGKILGGVVGGAGNVLMGAGMIPSAAGPAGVIASSALSIGLVMQGIGDLRGE